jgi:hypothetical protein
MIGPAARRHAMRALQAAGEAERNLHPGAIMGTSMLPLMRAQIEMIRAQAFALLQDGEDHGKQGSVVQGG